MHAEIYDMKTPQLLLIYNELADKEIKKFRDRPTALTRTARLLTESKMTVKDGVVVVDENARSDEELAELARREEQARANIAANAAEVDREIEEEQGGDRRAHYTLPPSERQRQAAMDAAHPTPHATIDPNAPPSAKGYTKIDVPDDWVLVYASDEYLTRGTSVKVAKAFDGKKDVATVRAELIEEFNTSVKAKAFHDDPTWWVTDWIKWVYRMKGIERV